MIHSITFMCMCVPRLTLVSPWNVCRHLCCLQCVFLFGCVVSFCGAPVVESMAFSEFEGISRLSMLSIFQKFRRALSATVFVSPDHGWLTCMKSDKEAQETFLDCLMQQPFWRQCWWQSSIVCTKRQYLWCCCCILFNVFGGKNLCGNNESNVCPSQ